MIVTMVVSGGLVDNGSGGGYLKDDADVSKEGDDD